MTTNPPILFLDIDGCLNRISSFDWSAEPQALLEPPLIRNFNKIIEFTSAEIVLSSSWRYNVLSGAMTLLGFERLLRSHGVRGSLIGTTCADDCCDTRGDQIRHWLREHKDRRPYVVIDDMNDGMTERGLSCVFTNGSHGLSLADANRAIEFLLTGCETATKQLGPNQTATPTCSLCGNERSPLFAERELNGICLACRRLSRQHWRFEDCIDP